MKLIFSNPDELVNLASAEAMAVPEASLINVERESGGGAIEVILISLVSLGIIVKGNRGLVPTTRSPLRFVI